MTILEALDFIHALHSTGKKNGLVNITRLLALLDNPQKSLRFVHVAGTNGKGSTTTMIASALRHAGYQTGLFISPFVLEFRERIQINNVFVTEEDLIEATEAVKICIEQLATQGCYPTEFEAVTAIAMYIFKKQGCEVVALEVGIGGLLDVTNVIDTPLVSVITSIGYDHTDVLGETLEEITAHKCGIIKAQGVTVCYPQQDPEALAVIMEHAALKNNVLVIGNLAAAEILKEDLDGTDMVYDGLPIHIGMIGKHQVANAITAVETLKQLRQMGFGIKDKDIIAGIGEVAFPARMEVISRKPLVIIDGAHNPSGMDALTNTLSLFGGRRLILIIGMLKGKDFAVSGAKIARFASKIIATSALTPRAIPAVDMAKMLKGYCKDVTAVSDLTEAFRLSYEDAKEDDVVLVCGSLLLASDLRKIAKDWMASAD